MKILTLGETATKLRLSRPTTVKLLRNGLIYGVRCRHQWRIAESAIESFLRGGGGGTTSGPEEQKAA
jgi:excisionase family DNA binding protein